MIANKRGSRLKDDSERIPFINTLLQLLYTDGGLPEMALADLILAFRGIMSDSDKSLDTFTNVVPLAAKLEFTKLTLNAFLHYLNDYIINETSYKDVVHLLNGIIRLSIRQKFSYEIIIDELNDIFKILLNVLKKNDQNFQIQLNCFQQCLPNNYFTLEPKWNKPLNIKSKSSAQKYLSIFCDILQFQIQFMLQFCLINSETIDQLVHCLQIGDPYTKTSAIDCIIKCFDAKKFNGLQNLSLLTDKRVVIIIDMLIQFTQLILVGKFCAMQTTMPSRLIFSYKIFEERWLHLFSLLIQSNITNDIVCSIACQKIFLFLKCQLIDDTSNYSNDIYWSIVTSYCELITKIPLKNISDIKFFFNVCIICIEHISSNIQFKRVSDLVVHLLSLCNKIDITYYNTAIDSIISLWRLKYVDICDNQTESTVNRFIINSRIINHLLLRKDLISDNIPINQLHICSQVQCDILMHPINLENIINNCGALKLLEIFAIFIEEFYVSNVHCKYSENEWRKIGELICLWYFEKGIQDDIEEKSSPLYPVDLLVNLQNSKFNPSLSYFLLSFLPNDIFALVKSNIFKYLWNGEYIENDLEILFESFRNNIMQNSNLDDIYHILESIYEKYRHNFLTNIKLTEAFFNCLKLLHCRVCGTHNNIVNSIKWRPYSDLYYPIHILLDISCRICTTGSYNVDLQSIGQENQIKIVSLILDIIIDYIKTPSEIEYESLLKSLLVSVVRHSSPSWSENSALIIIKIIKTCYGSNVHKLRYDCGIILFEFAKRMSVNSRLWLMLQQRLTDIFEEFIENEKIDRFPPVIYALESLLKVIPFQFVPLLIRLVCKIAIYSDNRLSILLNNMMKRITLHRKINAEQIFKSCTPVIVEIICSVLEFETYFIEKLSKMFNLDYTYFFKTLLPHIFIYLVAKGDPDSHLDITKLFESVFWLSTNKECSFDRAIQTNVIPECIVHFFLNISLDKFDEMRLFLRAQFGSSLEQLITYNDITRTIHLFMHHLSDKPTNVFNGIKWIAVEVLNIDGFPDRINNTVNFGMDKISNFLLGFSVGILDNFKIQLLNTSLTPYEQEKTVSSLEAFIKLIKNGLKNVHIMCFSILKICSKFTLPRLMEKSYSMWFEFITHLDNSDLETLLVEIIAVLLYLDKPLINKLKDILTYIFEKYNSLKVKICDLHFILEFPGLIQFHRPLQKIISDVSKSEDIFIPILQCCNRNLLHDNSCVRHLAVNNLFTTLSNNINRLESLMKIFKQDSEENTNNMELIHNLNHSLISAINKDSLNSKIVFARCLGLLGAVDPGRYREITVSGNISKTCEFVTSSGFSYAILCELGKAYLSVNNNKQMDAAAVAIQYILRVFKIQKSLFDSYTPINNTEVVIMFDAVTDTCAFNDLIIGNTLWDSLPKPTREILQPFLDSKYILLYIEDVDYVSLPTIMLSEGIQLDKWICKWTGYLLNLMKNEDHIMVLSHLNIIIKNDCKFSKYVLPHIILTLLIENEESVINNINLEIISIFKAISQLTESECNLKMDKLLNTSVSFVSSDTSQSSLSNFENNKLLQSAGQIIFNVLDYLHAWLHMTWSEILKNKNETDPKKLNLIKNHKLVGSFLKLIPNSLLAIASFNCGSLTRSIYHWMLAYRYDLNNEEDEEDNAKNRKEIILGLIHAHDALNNSDEVSGYLSTFKSVLEPLSPAVKLVYEGKYDLAVSIYEQELIDFKRNVDYNKSDPKILEIYQSIFRCQLFNLSSLPSLISRTQCCLNEETFPLEQYQTINSFRIEALYRIADWKRLEDYLKMENVNSDNFTISFTKSLCNAKNQKTEIAQIQLDELWKKTIANLEVSSIEGCDYERVHKDLSKFAFLTEIEMALATKQICKMPERSTNFVKYFGKINLSKLPEFFKQRYKISETKYINQESILTNHYNLYQFILETQIELSKVKEKKKNTVKFLNNLIGKIWLERCKVARRAGHFQSAMACLLHVEKLDYSEFIMERGKLLWKSGQVEESLSHLNQAIDYLCPDKSDDKYVFKIKHKVNRFWKLLLLRAHVSELTCRHDIEYTKELYNSVLEFEPTSEAAHFRLAHFLDNTMKITNDYNEPNLRHALFSYGKALTYGSKFVYQSMPRLLSLWLDKIKHSKETGSINTVMKKNINVIPKFQFYIALSQILSRMCHETNSEILGLLYHLVVQIFLAFPPQTVWSLISLEGSSFDLRRQRFSNLFELIKHQKKDMAEYIYKMIKLSKLLREISELNNTVQGKNPISLKKFEKSFDYLFKTENFSNVLMPLHHQLFGTLATSTTFSDSYSPFPSYLISVAGIDDSVDILPSLTKPKKMFWLGNDGKKYIIVAKPKDDLRRDCRIMEMNGMFNRLMQRNSETRHRLLYIRTYAVTPLGEKCGLIEWVNNTEGFRQIILNLLDNISFGIIWPKIIANYPVLEDSVDKKYEKFTKNILPIYPVVFHRWFLQKFPEPGSWYRSIQRYARSAAVMSMVGYILGLGDRHIENVLFDNTTGDIVHIDFNCLFNQGKSLQWSEVVPFRLTRNMQDALGPCREKNGLFRSSCEATLRLLRDEIEPIMAVFRPMCYDSLIEDQKGSSSNKPSNPLSITESKLGDIESRLKGKVNHLPLSVEGQVNALIEQAIDNRLLCQMYIGWGSFI